VGKLGNGRMDALVVGIAVAIFCGLLAAVWLNKRPP
jgi:hypothetical protein